jgi:tryptophan synthase beta chain
MGEEDMRRQALNVYRMEILGARVVPVSSGSRTLKDAINEAFRDWVSNVRTTHYVFGSAAGPHPYPGMVRDFQSVIGSEARRQIISAAGRLPTHVLACVGGGSNSIGMFTAFLKDRRVALTGVEAAGAGLRSGRHSATLSRGRPGILHGSLSFVLQDRFGQVLPTHSIAAGLDYPGVGPEHSYLKSTGRVSYVTATDRDALAGFAWLARMEGILPALEPAHVFGYLKRHARRFPARSCILVNLSGRGDKDVQTVSDAGRGGTAAGS